MAEAFVRTLKRDYVRVSPRPDARTVIKQLPNWLAHYNEVHPHRTLGYRSPASTSRKPARPRQAFKGHNNSHCRRRRSEAEPKAGNGGGDDDALITYPDRPVGAARVVALSRSVRRFNR